MRKYAVILVSLIGIVAVVSGVFAGSRRLLGVQVRFNKRDLPKQGVHIITSVDPLFEDTVSKYFKNKPPETLKPFSVFIKNSGSRTVLGYALTWEFVKSDGTVVSKTSAYSEPGVLMGNDVPNNPAFKHSSAIEPGAVRCFSWDSQIEEDADDRSGGLDISLTQPTQTTQRYDPSSIRAQLASQLAQATDLTVSLDGVVFDDGIFVGPNVSGFFEHLQAAVNAKVDLLRDFEIASHQGKVDQALESIASKSLEPNVTLQSKSSPQDYYNYYRKLFADEITNMNRAVGKERMVSYLIASHNRVRPILRKE